jgi:hypothetical protein
MAEKWPRAVELAPQWHAHFLPPTFCQLELVADIRDGMLKPR